MKKLLFCIVLLSYSNIAGALTLKFTEAELQEKVSAMMPLEKKKGFITIVFSDPVVKLLKESNKIGIKTNMAAKIPGGIKGTGMAEITGSLSYNKDESTFHMLDPVITTMHIDKVPDKFQPKIKALAQKSLSKTMATRPIYKLRDDNMKHKLAKSTLKNISVKDGKLLVEFSLF